MSVHGGAMVTTAQYTEIKVINLWKIFLTDTFSDYHSCYHLVRTFS